MRTVTKIIKESQINSLLKNKKGEDFMILYHSTWDEKCQKLMDQVKVWEGKNGNESLHTVSSWDVPHGFMAFRVTQVPALITCKKGRIRKEFYYSRVFGRFEM